MSRACESPLTAPPPNCPASGKDANGIYCDRIEVSSAFYRSAEFHGRGYFIYRFYSAALGVKQERRRT